MIDESDLAAGIFEKFSKCLAMRERYQKQSLQREKDNPKNGISTEAVRPMDFNFRRKLP